MDTEETKNIAKASNKEQYEFLERSQKLYINITDLLSGIVELSEKQKDIQKNLVKQQLDELNLLISSGEVSDGIFLKKRDLLQAEYNIRNATESQLKENKSLLEDYKRAVKNYQDLENAATRRGKAEEVLQKAGIGWLIAVKDLVKEYGILGVTIIGIGILVKQLYNDFRSIDAAAAEFRKTIGITRDNSERLEKIARNITFQFAGMGVTAADVYKSMLAVTSTIGSSQVVTEMMVRDITLLSVQLGVAESTSAEFLRIMGQVSKSIMSSQSDISLFTAALSAAAGTNLNEVMGDVSSAAKTGYQFLSRDPLVLAKAAVEARRMGTSLQSSTTTASSLLNFTQNVKDEMEASVLLGKSMNLQKARELAYHRDILGLNREILNIANQTDFDHLDPFQQDAVARALGKSADELAKMLQADREMNAMKQSNDKLVKSSLSTYEKLMNANKELAKDAAEKQRQDAMALANAAAIKTVTLALHGILQRLLQGPITLIAWTLTNIAKVLNTINKAMGQWVPLGAIALSWIDDIAIALVGLAALFWGPKLFGGLLKVTQLNKLFGSFGDSVGNFIKKVSSKFKSVGKTLEEFSLNIKNIIINISSGIRTGIQSIFLGISRGLRTLSDPKLLIGVAVLALLGASIIPFAYGMKMMVGIGWKTFAIAASSIVLLTLAAAGLGALMASGVGAVALLLGAAAIATLGTSLIPAAYAMKIAGAGFKSLGDGLKETVDSLVELQQLSFLGTIKQIFQLTSSIVGLSKALSSMPKIDITPLSKYANVAVDINTPVKEQKVKPTPDVTNKDVVDAINALTSYIKGGGAISNVFIDSQKLDSVVGRRLAYTGALT